MPSLQRLFRTLSLLIACTASTTCFAQQPPTYSRMRQGADDWQARGGGYGYSFPSYAYGGYFPIFVPPVVTGSWYQRPYPYHFDVARQRWSGPSPAQQGDEQGYPETMPRSDCPCANEVTPTPAN